MLAQEANNYSRDAGVSLQLAILQTLHSTVLFPSSERICHKTYLYAAMIVAFQYQILPTSVSRCLARLQFKADLNAKKYFSILSAVFISCLWASWISWQKSVLGRSLVWSKRILFFLLFSSPKLWFCQIYTLWYTYVQGCGSRCSRMAIESTQKMSTYPMQNSWKNGVMLIWNLSNFLKFKNWITH